MEVTAKRCIALAVVLIGFGALARLQPPRLAPSRTEAWMESVLPTEIPGYTMARSLEKPNQSYDAGKRQYEYLQPYGIVCRVFNKGDVSIDTVVIAGNDRDTFHDPFFCLPGQNWQITQSGQIKISTKTRGDIPATQITLRDPNGMEHHAIFFYKGPSGFHPTQNSLYMDWFMNELKQGKPAEGAFYRFLSLNAATNEQEVMEVVGEYIESAGDNSDRVL